MKSKACITLVVTLMVFTILSPAQTKRDLTEAEAVRSAEEFIASNGYTDLPPIQDKTKLSFETIEWASNVDELLKLRHNTLERKAYGIQYNGRMGKGRWIVAFRSKYPCKDCNTLWGRAVTMNKDGSNIRVEHKDFPLLNVQKKL